MGKLVSDLDYQDVLGTSQRSYERVEYISNTTPVVINSGICPTEKTKFEIKICLSEKPIFWMGSYDFTEGRKTARLFSNDGRFLIYDYPNDWGGEGRTRCVWSQSRPDTIHEEFPHVIEFGNKFVRDLTSNRETNGNKELFSTKAPFGLFGIVEYKGDGLPFGYVIPQSEVYKIYYFRVFEKDQLIADMIPVKDQNGILCMFDMVRNQYFYPVNESGENVNLTTYKEPSKDDTLQEGKRDSFTSFFRKKLDSLQYALRGERKSKKILVLLLIIIPLIVLLFGAGSLVNKIFDWSIDNNDKKELVVPDNKRTKKDVIIKQNKEDDDSRKDIGKASDVVKEEQNNVVLEPSASTSDLTIEHNAERGGRLGMYIYSKQNYRNLKGVSCYTALYFMDDKGKLLEGKRVKDANGYFCYITRPIIPETNNVTNEQRTFIPYEEFSMPDTGTVYFNCALTVFIEDDKQQRIELATSSPARFHLSR